MRELSKWMVTQFQVGTSIMAAKNYFTSRASFFSIQWSEEKIVPVIATLIHEIPVDRRVLGSFMKENWEGNDIKRHAGICVLREIVDVSP